MTMPNFELEDNNDSIEFKKEYHITASPRISIRRQSLIDDKGKEVEGYKNEVKCVVMLPEMNTQLVNFYNDFKVAIDYKHGDDACEFAVNIGHPINKTGKAAFLKPNKYVYGHHIFIMSLEIEKLMINLLENKSIDNSTNILVNILPVSQEEQLY